MPSCSPQMPLREIDNARFSCSHASDGLFEVRFLTSVESIASLVEVLHMAQVLAERMKREVKNSASMVAGQAQAQALHREQHHIAELYYEARRQGLQHRRAVALVTDLPEVKQLKYSKIDVARCAKAFPDAEQVLQLNKEVHYAVLTYLRALNGPVVDESSGPATI